MRRRDWIILWVLIIGAVALGIRIMYLMQFSASPLFCNTVGPDVEEYDLWAKQIIAGKLLWNYVHIHAPLYAYALALEYWVFAFNHFNVRLFQLMIGLASVVPVLFSLRIIDGKWTIHSLLLASIWAVYPPLIYYQAEYISEALLLPLVCISIYLLYRGERDEIRHSTWFAVAGVAGGLAIITHPMAGLFVLGEALYLLFLQKTRFKFKLKSSFRFLLAASLVVGPVALYNYKVLGKLAPVQANSGLNFYLGNNSDANGTCYLRPGPEWNKVHQQARKISSAAFVTKDQYFLSESSYFIKNYPLFWANLVAQKALFTWNFRELTSGADPYPLKYFTPLQNYSRWAFALVAILALMGIFMNIGERSFLYNYRHFLILIFSFWLVQIIFLTSGRYRIAMLPGIFVIAAFTVEYIMTNFRASFHNHLLPYAGIAMAIVLLPAPDISLTRESAEADTLLGEAYMKSGDLASAEKHLLKASTGLSNWSRSYNLLGLLSERKKDISTAEQYYQKALECDESDPYGLMNLGVLHSYRRNFKKANDCFKRAFEIDDMIPDLHYNYAVFISKYRGNEILSERHYWKCLELDPSHRKALNNLGVIQMIKGNYAEAEKYFSHALRVEPSNPDLIVNLAAAEFAQDRRAEAEKLLRKALGLNPTLPSAKELEKIMKGTAK